MEPLAGSLLDADLPWQARAVQAWTRMLLRKELLLTLQAGKPDEAAKAVDEAQALLKASSLELQLEGTALQAHLAKVCSCYCCHRCGH